MTHPIKVKRAAATDHEQGRGREDDVDGPLGMVPVLAPLRRQMVAPEDEDDVFELEAAKRQARVDDLGLEKLVSGPDHSALEQAIGAKQAKGPDHRPMAAIRGRRKQEVTQTARERRSEVAGIGQLKTVSGRTGEEGAALGATLATKQEIGASDRPLRAVHRHEKGLAEEQRKGELAEGRQAEYEADLDHVTAKEEELATVLAAGRAAAGTADESAEMTKLDDALDQRDWKAAKPLLDQVAAESQSSLAAATSALDGRRADIASVKEHPANHQPPDVAGTEAALDKAISAGQWTTVGSRIKEFLRSIDLALDFEKRMEQVEAETGTLDNPGRRSTMEGWIAEHQQLTWTQVCESAEKISAAKGGLANLEDRLQDYQERDLAEVASAQKAKTQADNSKAASVASKAAAKVLKAERIAKGLLSGNGTIIAEMKTSALTGTGEKDAVESALQHYKAGTRPVLTHSSGMKWGDPHGNRDGDLPGVAGSGGYLEYYIEKDPADAKYHGGRRLVVHTSTKRTYYTWTHYGSNGNPAFVLISE